MKMIKQSFIAAALAVIAGSALANEPTVGKSRLEVAQDLAKGCIRGLTQVFPSYEDKDVEDCVTARLRTLDNAIRRAAQ
jgi:hypothetical protein